MELSLSTTVIGCFPKPEYLSVPDWFHSPENFVEEYSDYIKKTKANYLIKDTLRKATKEVLDIQDGLGIDVVTDGELPRENYLHYFCRRLKGIDFKNLTEKSCRNGAWVGFLPTIVDKIEPANEEPWVHLEWKESQKMSKRPVKITLPGPMSIINSVCNSYYNNDEELSCTLVEVLNREIRALAKAGCQYIQVDEPVLVRLPDKALEYGIDHLAKCFEGIPTGVTKCIHLCCGYPSYLDQKDYLKADPGVYLQIADKLDSAGFHQISIEDAHKHNDLELFKHFKKSKLIVGVVKIASSKVESVEEIKERLQEILTVFPPERLIVAPDCGLGYLSTALAVSKLKNMVEAAKSLALHSECNCSS